MESQVSDIIKVLSQQDPSTWTGGQARAIAQRLLEVETDVVEPLLEALRHHIPPPYPAFRGFSVSEDHKCYQRFMYHDFSALVEVSVLVLGARGDRLLEPLLLALEEPNPILRKVAAEALGLLGDLHALMPLMQMVAEETTSSVSMVAYRGLEALGRLGDVRAIEVIIPLLDREPTRMWAAQALAAIGEPNSLPRKIVADRRLTAQERSHLLDRLHDQQFYPPTDTNRMCRRLLKDPEDGIREGARAILEFRTLGRASQPDQITATDQLLRGVGEPPSIPREQHLQPSTVPKASQPEETHAVGFLARFLKGRKRQ